MRMHTSWPKDNDFSATRPEWKECSSKYKQYSEKGKIIVNGKI